MKGKKIYLIIALIILLLSVSFFFLNHNKHNPIDSEENQQTETASKKTKNENDDQDSSTNDEDLNEKNSGHLEESEKNNVSSNTNRKNTSNGYWEGNKFVYEESGLGKNEDNTEESIKLPYTIPGTSLTIEEIGRFSGIYIENGSDQDVENVVALSVKNSGDETIEYSEIKLKTSEGDLNFVISSLPGNSRTLIQEANQSGLQFSKIKSVNASVSDPKKVSLNTDTITISEKENNSLTVKNISSKDLKSVRIFYKFFDSSQDSFIGGITYTINLEDLAAGDSIDITPSHYSKGNSKVVDVRIYEEWIWNYLVIIF